MSRPQVTITLGRSGQVVKRAGNTLNESRSSSSGLSGSKRLRERLGGNADNVPSNWKRRRGETNGNSNAVQDLRVKLTEKRKAKQIKNTNNAKHHNMSGQGYVSTAEPSSLSSRQHVHGPNQESSSRRIPPTRSADDLLQLNSVERSYSSWDRQRHLSPDRIASGSRELSLRYGSPDRRVGASRGHVPLRPLNRQHQVLAYRPGEGSRGSSYAGQDVYDHERPFAARTASEATRSIPRRHPQRSIPHNSSYLESLSVGSFLNPLGLGKYAILFQAEEIDMAVLRHMQDNDLKDMGIPMGPRRKILLSLLSLSRRT